jgi:hypothetical protein
MVRQGTGRASLRSWLSFLAVAAISILLQFDTQAWWRDFTTSPDEPVHYMNALLVRDYLAAMAPEPPMRFAERYYLHYPLLAIGHWPPGYAFLQGLWMLFFGVARIPALACMALLTALLGWVVWREVSTTTGELLGAAAAVLLLTRPVVAVHASSLMADIPLALSCLAAALVFARFLETGQRNHALWYAAFAIAAIMMKGSALGLAFHPPLAILFSRRWERFRSRWLYLAAVLVALVCVPWYAAFREYAWLERVPLKSKPLGIIALHTLQVMAANTLCDWGIGFVLLALLGAAFLLRTCSSASLTACVAALILFVGVISPHREPRHLIPVYAALACLAVQAAAKITRGKTGLALALLAVACLAGWLRFTGSPKRDLGVRPFAAALAGKTVLVSSERMGVAGAFIAESAMLDPARPSRTIMRADKLLAKTSHTIKTYTPPKETPAELLALLERIGVEFLVFDRPVGVVRPHHQLLERTIASFPSSFVRFPVPGAPGSSMEAYRLVRPTPARPRTRNSIQ